MLNKIIEKYDHIILDIWGVMHDGKHLLPYAKEFLEALEKHNKNYYFLSNAPRPAAVTHKRLEEIGLHGVDVKKITTSGDLLLANFDYYSKKKLYIFDEESNTDLLAGKSIIKTDDVGSADYLLIFSFGFDEADLMRHFTNFEKAAEIGITMICPNPDLVVNNGDRLCYTPGAYARIYENMGGKVIYFGKPYKEAYEFIFNKYNMDPDKTIMIGDSLETDIRGADNAGIDSLLLLSGIHKHEGRIKELYKKHNVTPTYTLDDLQIGEINCISR